MAGPVDPRLLRAIRPARRWILISGVLAASSAAATITLGICLGLTVSAMLTEPESPGDFVVTHTGPLTVLAVAALARVAVEWLQARIAGAATAAIIAELRTRALTGLTRRDPRTVPVGRWRTLLTTGLDGLGDYIGGFLPSLVTLVIATPIALAAVAWLDLRSSLIAVLTLPLIPLFMWLVGKLTAGRTERRLADMATVREQILDLAVGAPTLRAHGMLAAPTSEIARLSAAHHRSTMSVLRIAFLSAAVLEFFATISVALIAVGIGLRLLAGAMELGPGLAALVIVAEVYRPVRDVGKRFHEAQDGAVAAGAVLDVLDDAPGGPHGVSCASAPDGLPAGVHVHVRGLDAVDRDGVRPAGLSLDAGPGEVVALTGPNGSGKSTALLAILGVAVDGVTGEVCVWEAGDDGAAVLRGEELFARCTFVAQRPLLDTNAMASGAAELSAGQIQRRAVYAALADARPLVLLDEPTAHVDEPNARRLAGAIRAVAAAGATVIAATHDPVLVDGADRVVEVTAGMRHD